MSDKLRVLIGKVGLDGHDLGAKFVSRLLMNAGIEVIYTGLGQTAEQVVAAAIQEDVRIIGLSCYGGNHKEVAARVIQKLKERKASIPLIFGGLIPSMDIQDLKKMGVAGVFPEGTPPGKIVEFVNQFQKKEVG